MENEIRLEAKRENIGAGVEFVENYLRSFEYEKKKLVRCVLSVEEILVQLVENAKEDAFFKIVIKGGKKQHTVNISCLGNQCSISDAAAMNLVTDYDEQEDEKASVISGLILKAFSDSVNLKYSQGMNRAFIKISKSENDGSKFVLICLALGILLGVVFRFTLPVSAGQFLIHNVFSFVSDVFLRAIKFVVAPLVFFSIAESIMGFSDFTTFGRIGAKVIAIYLCTTMAAITLAYTSFRIISPGDPSILAAVEQVANSNIEYANITISLRDMLEKIVPSNLVDAFATSDMLQIIAIAVVVGIASGAIGEYSVIVQNFIRAGNALFSKITTYIIKLLPVAVFSLMIKFVYTIDASAIFHIAKAFATFLVAIACMMILYSILLLVFAKTSPLYFFRKFKKAAIMAFSTSSSSATMPITMSCLDDIGVSPKIYSFSIPIGATINMDGASITFTVITLFMAKIYGIEMNSSMLFSLFLSIILLSVGAPSIGGAGLAFYALLFAQVGIPVEAVAFILPLDTIIEFFDTLSNVTGDAVVTMIVAKNEGLVTSK